MLDKVSDVERWRPIPGYEGLYDVSDQGRIRSHDRLRRNGAFVPGRVLKPQKNSTGRLHVGLRAVDGAVKSMKVHRAVLLAFVGPNLDGMEGCHNDGDPTNNRVSNLRWDTRKANSADAVRMRRFPAQQRTHCPRGHALADPNLTPAGKRNGWRVCLACSRASAYARVTGVEFTKELGDRYHQKILEVA